MDEPAKWNITAGRGSNRPILKFRLENPDDGSPQDLTGANLIAVAEVADGRIIASLSDGGLIHGQDGYVTWALSIDDSYRIRPGALTRYAIERVDPGGDQYPVIVGVIIGRDYPNVD